MRGAGVAASAAPARHMAVSIAGCFASASPCHRAGQQAYAPTAPTCARIALTVSVPVCVLEWCVRVAMSLRQRSTASTGEGGQAEARDRASDVSSRATLGGWMTGVSVSGDMGLEE